MVFVTTVVVRRPLVDVVARAGVVVIRRSAEVVVILPFKVVSSLVIVVVLSFVVVVARPPVVVVNLPFVVVVTLPLVLRLPFVVVDALKGVVVEARPRPSVVVVSAQVSALHSNVNPVVAGFVEAPLMLILSWSLFETEHPLTLSVLDITSATSSGCEVAAAAASQSDCVVIVQ